MLLQFSVKNMLSFRDEATLSFVAAPGVTHTEDQVIRLPGGPDVLRCVAVYGANASGKSNLVKALDAVVLLIREGTAPNKKLDIKKFKLVKKYDELESEFSIVTCLDGALWTYGARLGVSRVEEEWLLRTVEGVERTVFHRRAGEGPQPEVELGEALELATDRVAFVGFVAQGTRHNQLFLTECLARNVHEVGPVPTFLTGRILGIGPEFKFYSLAMWVNAYEGFRTAVSSLLAGADTGVTQVRRKTLDDEEPAALRFTPVGADEGVEFKEDELSDGTRRLLHLSPVVQLASDQSTATVILDELDRSLHPALSRYVLQRFMAKARGTNNQFLFTTHDTNLLDADLLSPDAIWFAERDATGNSTLYSLSEFKPEQLAQLKGHIEEGYLQGRFGAIPSLADLKRTSGKASP